MAYLSDVSKDKIATSSTILNSLFLDTFSSISRVYHWASPHFLLYRSWKPIFFLCMSSCSRNSLRRENDRSIGKIRIIKKYQMPVCVGWRLQILQPVSIQKTTITICKQHRAHLAPPRCNKWGIMFRNGIFLDANPEKVTSCVAINHIKSLSGIASIICHNFLWH